MIHWQDSIRCTVCGLTLTADWLTYKWQLQRTEFIRFAVQCIRRVHSRTIFMAQQINELSSTNKSITLMLMTILAGLIHWICTANENWYCGGCVWYLGRCIWYLGLCIWYLARYIWYLVRYTWYWARWVLYLNWICTSVRVSPFSHQAVPTNFTSMLHFNSLPFSAHQSDGPWLACELARRREDCAKSSDLAMLTCPTVLLLQSCSFSIDSPTFSFMFEIFSICDRGVKLGGDLCQANLSQCDARAQFCDL